jgi:hypothetical protein
MKKIMYEVNWHYDTEGSFSHCSVTPITVTRESILPGCQAVSISAIGADGHSFNGSPKDYFNSQEAAWCYVREELRKSLENLKIKKEKLELDIQRIEKSLSNISSLYFGAT